MVVVLAFLFLPAFALGDDIRVARLGNLYLWYRVPSTALGGSGALISQSEECGDVVPIVCGQFFQHLLITYPLAESRDDGSIRDTGDCPTYLGEAGNERSEGLLRLLPYSVEVCLHSVPLVSASEVRHKPRTELFPGADGPWGLIHEPSLGWSR
jgi:hypothetical protein